MITLGIDCTTKSTNIGIASDGIILGETNLELGRQQSAKLPLLVERLLDETSTSLAEINLIAAAKGPGYYTGIRTGVAYAAALAEALGVSAVPLSTMELFVYDLRTQKRPLASILKARQSYAYCALYISDGENLTAKLSPSFCKAAEFAEILKDYPDALIVGADREIYQELFSLPNETLSRISGSGGQAALMGEARCSLRIAPSLLRGEYLREPDIGPTTQS